MAPDRDRQIRAARRVWGALLRPAPDLFSAITAVNNLPLFVQAVPVADFSPFSVLDNQVPSEHTDSVRSKTRRSTALSSGSPQNQNRGSTSLDGGHRGRSSLHADVESGAGTSKVASADVAITNAPARPAVPFPALSFRTRPSAGGSPAPPARRRLLSFPAVSTAGPQSSVAPATGHGSAPDIPAAVRTIVSKLRGMSEEPAAAPEQTAGALISSMTVISELVDTLLIAPARPSNAPEVQPGVAPQRTVIENLAEARTAVLQTFASTIETSRSSADPNLEAGASRVPAVPIPADTHPFDAESLTFLVNQVLAEQARRHGVDLS